MRTCCVFWALAEVTCVLLPLPAWAGKPSSLAQYVPADARLFLEVQDMSGLAKTPMGLALAGMLADWVKPADEPPQSQPTGEVLNTNVPWWQRLFADSVGLDNPRAVALLFSGCLGLAADGWSGLGDAILLAEPSDPAALEIELRAFRVSASSDKAVRLYRLEENHELVCNGRAVVLGRRTNRTGLLMRTTELWENRRGVSLGDLAEFRERSSALPPGSQLFFYSATRGTVPSSGWPVMGDWWPVAWPQVISTAVGVSINAEGIIVGTSRRLEPESPEPIPCDPPIHLLLLLPDSTVVAWTRPIDYIQEFHQLDAAYSDGIFRVYLDIMQSGLPPGALEEHLFKHLVGDTIFFLGQTGQRSLGAEGGKTGLILPAAALMVETDDPYAVEMMLQRITFNLISVLNTQSGQSESARTVSVATESLGGQEGGILYSVDLSPLFPSTKCEFLRSLEISWTVADRWLVLGTHSGTVRKIVRARWGQAPAMSADWINKALPTTPAKSILLETVLVAQPQEASAMISSWVSYLSRLHPEMIQPDWWRRLRQKQHASSIQLGILPRRERALAGQVEVLETLPNYPAHGRLEPGDLILAVDGQLLDKTATQKSLRELLAMRQQSDRVRLLVIRGGREQEIDIEMPVASSAADRIQPVDLLRQVAGIFRLLSSISYISWRQSPDVIESRLELKLAPSGVTH